jgi:hypothetical protein
MSDHVKSDYIRLGFVRSWKERLSQVRLCLFRSVHVSSGYFCLEQFSSG